MVDFNSFSNAGSYSWQNCISLQTLICTSISTCTKLHVLLWYLESHKSYSQTDTHWLIPNEIYMNYSIKVISTGLKKREYIQFADRTNAENIFMTLIWKKIVCVSVCVCVSGSKKTFIRGQLNLRLLVVLIELSCRLSRALNPNPLPVSLAEVSLVVSRSIRNELSYFNTFRRFDRTLIQEWNISCGCGMFLWKILQ